MVYQSYQTNCHQRVTVFGAEGVSQGSILVPFSSSDTLYVSELHDAVLSTQVAMFCDSTLQEAHALCQYYCLL